MRAALNRRDVWLAETLRCHRCRSEQVREITMIRGRRTFRVLIIRVPTNGGSGNGGGGNKI
jgi:hypothetical protein